ncbi:MAG: SpoIVB peptidase [Schaedlerella sp.]|nr:SpoIVB peptidase [Schaedlerella sp.]
MKNRWMKRYGLLCLLVICSLISGSIGRILAEAAPGEEAASSQIHTDTVFVGGMPVGIYMETDGVLVLSTQEMKNIDGAICEPARNYVKSGDYIVGLNQMQIRDKDTLIKAVANLDSKEAVLQIRRKNETIEVKMEAIEVKEEEYKLGIWVRDNIQGLGTITYLDSDGNYGALGHGIHDIDISTLIDVAAGSLYKTRIRTITKGENGTPGSMEGVIVYSDRNKIGTITENTEIGIYGNVDSAEEVFGELTEVKVASKDEIKTGPAKIRCSIDGEIKEYAAKILSIDKTPVQINKGILLQVTDEELLKKTGGIIQGMSGSPVIQNGRIVGAVTHVLVNDPTRGYGIFIENMLEAAE